jgi:hypothetical protein
VKIININGVDYIPLALYEQLDTLYSELDQAHDSLVDHPSELDDDERKAKKKRDKRCIALNDRYLRILKKSSEKSVKA